MHKKRYLGVLGFIALSSILMVGCTSDKEDLKNAENGLSVSVEDTANKGTDGTAQNTQKEPTKEEKEQQEKEQAKIKKVNIWIPNIDYVSTGDESLEKLLEVEVDSVPSDSVEDDYMLMLKTLNLRGDTAIQSVVFNSAKLNEGKLTIDMKDASEQGLGGSLSEYMILEQIKLTMFANFDEVKSIQLTVDGKIAESFLGHIDITQAFER